MSMKGIGSLLIFSVLVLNGCGGGGGAASTPASIDCAPTVEGCLTPAEYRERIENLQKNYTNRAEFTNQWGLATINADTAWAKLQLKHGLDTAPGSGITLGAIDSGIDQGHPVFKDKRIHEQFLDGARDEDGSQGSHGTAVASVMVARPPSDSSQFALGVAWGADIAMFALPLGTAPSIYTPIRPDEIDDDRWANIINTVIGWSDRGRSLDFVNASVGHQGIIDLYSKSNLDLYFKDTVNAIAQRGSSSKTVFVFAAGNSHVYPCREDDFMPEHKDLCDGGSVNAKSVSLVAGLPARFPELRGNLVAVVAIVEHGIIAPDSNRCGIAADWCIAAPGYGINVAFSRQQSTIVSGTSFAAPMVTGGLAVMKHFFRDQLSNTALVERLYATANKSELYDDKSIYGQGLMDLDAAVSPVGFTYAALGDRVNNGQKVSMDGTSLVLGTAFGDGLSQAFAGQQIAAFDQLGAPFWYSLDEFARTRSSPSIQSRLAKFMSSTKNDHEFGIFRPALGALPAEHSASNSNRLSLGLMDTPALVNDGGHLSLLGRAVALNRSVSDKSTFRLYSTEGNGDQARVAGMEFVSRTPGKPIAFRSGVVAERKSVLRSAAAGAFGRMSGNSVFVGLESNLQVGSWRLGAGAEVGTVLAVIDRSVLSVDSALITSAFALRAGKKLNERNSVDFALSQPVRIESGRVDYTIPVGRTVEGEVLKSSSSADLEPSRRQVDLTAQWHRSLPSGNGDFRLATSLSLHPGHSRAAEPKISVLAGWRLGF